MLISIVIPLYNKQKYIARTIQSVLNQTYTFFELIIVNDGSTDDSVKVVNSFHDSRIRLIQQENGGVSKARNNGVLNAQGDWVAFLDADDEYEISFIEEVQLFVQNYKKDGLVFVGANYYINSKEQIAFSVSYKSNIYNYFELFDNLRTPNHSSTTLVNRLAFLQSGGFPERVKHYEDWITWFKLGIIGDFGYINKPLGIYHYVEDSVAHSIRNYKDFYKDAVQLPLQTINFLKTNPVENSKRKSFYKSINSFSWSIAQILAIQGEKRLSLKMLRFTSFKLMFYADKEQIYSTLIHLCLPLFIKNVFRRYFGHR